MIYSWVESWEAMAFIYVITNDINGKQYVGKTNYSIRKRFQEHIRDSQEKRCKKRPLYSAMNKYGIEHFHISILEECSAEDSAEREIYWIDKLQTYGHNGYNATRGGDSKKYYDYDVIAQKYQELGNQQLTADFFKCDISTVRIACKAKGIHIYSSSEQSKRLTGKAVAMYDKNSNTLVQIFNSIREAGVFLGDRNKARHIVEVADGKRKSAYGYYWKYIDGGLE